MVLKVEGVDFGKVWSVNWTTGEVLWKAGVEPNVINLPRLNSDVDDANGGRKARGDMDDDLAVLMLDPGPRN